ncbi:RodZ family helix-turn-helix domain-containing protein [Zoogloea dura]|uniref:Uncharacterized protein n=1 Tax=Zoogloea dura TaxID=2728840 RepID=A0A848FZ68_9RHOO|nr:hypothetical protein [Zoogloea dura]NML24322.1 hypothetical protein [Zoogloea dura]
MPTTNQQFEFIANAIESGGQLTPQQAAQLLEMGDIQGDTGAQAPETGSVPGAATATEGVAENATKTNTDQDPAAQAAGATPENAAATPPEDQLNADNAVILARDGKHTISFDKLAAARTEAKTLAAQLDAATKQLADLQAQANARAAAGQVPTPTDNQVAAVQAAIDSGVDLAIFGDFSEAAMAEGIKKLVAQQVAAQVAAQVGQALKPIQAKEQADATTGHFQAIYTAHPDADSIVDSREFAAWQASLPSIVRDAYSQALAKGGANQVIEVFDTFKKATAGTQAQAAAALAQQPAADPAAAAKAAIAKAAATPPASLSDIPGGRPAGTSREEAMAGMNSVDLLDAMSGMSPEQIERYLNSQI